MLLVYGFFFLILAKTDESEISSPVHDGEVSVATEDTKEPPCIRYPVSEDIKEYPCIHHPVFTETFSNQIDLREKKILLSHANEAKNRSEKEHKVKRENTELNRIGRCRPQLKSSYQDAAGHLWGIELFSGGKLVYIYALGRYADEIFAINQYFLTLGPFKDEVKFFMRLNRHEKRPLRVC